MLPGMDEDLGMARFDLPEYGSRCNELRPGTNNGDYLHI